MQLNWLRCSDQQACAGQHYCLGTTPPLHVALSDLFYTIGGDASTFCDMLDRIHERPFGYCLPSSLKCSLDPEGLRVSGTLPAGYSGFGPLDGTPFWYAPVPLLPMMLPLEYRTDLAECGWQQAPYESILESVRAMSVVTNQRFIFMVNAPLSPAVSDTFEDFGFLGY